MSKGSTVVTPLDRLSQQVYVTKKIISVEAGIELPRRLKVQVYGMKHEVKFVMETF